MLLRRWLLTFKSEHIGTVKSSGYVAGSSIVRIESLWLLIGWIVGYGEERSEG